jgi:hypothetical protein
MIECGWKVCNFVHIRKKPSTAIALDVHPIVAAPRMRHYREVA